MYELKHESQLKTRINKINPWQPHKYSKQILVDNQLIFKWGEV